MPADYFLKIDGITGESQDAKHKGEIEIDSFSWGQTQDVSADQTHGSGTGRVVMHDFHFTMKANMASPQIALACAQGKHIPKAVFACRKAGGKQEEYLKYTFSQVVVSGTQTG